MSTQTTTVDIEARYQHEWPQGQQYVFNGQGVAKVGINRVVAQGVPYHIIVSHNGDIWGQCTYEPAIFIDGWESGDTSEWDAVQ